MNASETLLREILREVKKQNVLLEKIDRKLSRDEDISPDEMERRESFRRISTCLGKRFAFTRRRRTEKPFRLMLLVRDFVTVQFQEKAFQEISNILCMYRKVPVP